MLWTKLWITNRDIMGTIIGVTNAIHKFVPTYFWHVTPTVLLTMSILFYCLFPGIDVTKWLRPNSRLLPSGTPATVRPGVPVTCLGRAGMVPPRSRGTRLLWARLAGKSTESPPGHDVPLSGWFSAEPRPESFAQRPAEAVPWAGPHREGPGRGGWLLWWNPDPTGYSRAESTVILSWELDIITDLNDHSCCEKKTTVLQWPSVVFPQIVSLSENKYSLLLHLGMIFRRHHPWHGQQIKVCHRRYIWCSQLLNRSSWMSKMNLCCVLPDHILWLWSHNSHNSHE